MTLVASFPPNVLKTLECKSAGRGKVQLLMSL